MKNKIRSTVLVFALVLLGAFALTGCGKKVVLVDFPATATDTVEVGDSYKLKRVVEDEAGGRYQPYSIFQIITQTKKV